MNFPVKNATGSTKQDLEAVLGDVHFLEMLLDADRASALRNGASPDNRDEEAFVEALKQVAKIRASLGE